SAYSEAALRENVMTYVMPPRLLYAEFGGKTLAQKLFKDAWVEEYDHDSKQVYFGLDKSRVSREMLPVYISDFIINTSRVEFAVDSGTEVKLKDYTADSVKFYTAYLFRTPLDNVKVDIDRMLDFGVYQISMREMADFMANNVVYGGNPEVQSPNSKAAASILMGNHGVFVARPNEPSLQRFVRNYFSRFPGSQSAPRERRIQLLLDLVSEEIDFDTREANSSKEGLKLEDGTVIS